MNLFLIRSVIIPSFIIHCSFRLATHPMLSLTSLIILNLTYLLFTWPTDILNLISIFNFCAFFSSLAPKRKWTLPQTKGCIKGRENGRVNNVPDLTACQILCEKSSIVKCVSVNFWKNAKTCFFNDADSSTVAIESPCPYLFSEPLRTGRFLN